jgi:FkbM family methyltransferase
MSVFAAVSCKLKHCVYLVRRTIGLPPRTDAESCYRLFRLIRGVPRCMPGEFQVIGGTLRFVDGLSAAHQFQDIFIKRVYDFTCESPVRLIVDCGGNIGLSVVWFKQRYPKSKIVVFEADPSIARVLEQNLKALQFDDVEVVKAAVSTVTGTTRFAQDGADGGRISKDVSLEVPTIRLADWVTEQVDLLKVDIEGEEFDVLADMCRTGKIRLVQRLICELHNREGDFRKVGELLSVLAQHGFRICLSHARPAPDIAGQPQPTPFPLLVDGKCLVQLYAWQV